MELGRCQQAPHLQARRLDGRGEVRAYVYIGAEPERRAVAAVDPAGEALVDPIQLAPLRIAEAVPAQPVDPDDGDDAVDLAVPLLVVEVDGHRRHSTAPTSGGPQKLRGGWFYGVGFSFGRVPRTAC